MTSQRTSVCAAVPTSPPPSSRRVGWASASGRSAFARLFSLVQLGDYASYYLALLYGVDPTPVAAIQAFKAKLAGD